MEIFKHEIDIDYYEHIGIIKQHFPLHDAYRVGMQASWKKYRRRLFLGLLKQNYTKLMQPLNFIVNYYGEKLGFYFTFLMFYTSFLMVPAIPGLALAVYQACVQQVDTQLNLLYAAFVAVWSTFMFEYWKRTEQTVKHLWNMDAVQQEETERKQFKHEKTVDINSKKIVKMNFIKTRLRKLLVSLPSMIMSVLLVIAVFVGYRIIYRTTNNINNQTLAASGNSVFIILFGVLYEHLALKLVDWENHRYD